MCFFNSFEISITFAGQNLKKEKLNRNITNIHTDLKNNYNAMQYYEWELT